MSGYPAVDGSGPAREPALAALVTALREQHRGAIRATLAYGSCLRSGDIYDGLLDIYLICDSYRAAYGAGLLAAANRLLPPNVFYVEQSGLDADGRERTLRAKVSVISLHDFRRGCSRAWFQSYIWGRFAQPTAVVYARDAAAMEELDKMRLDAARTLLYRAIPALPSAGTVEALWEGALGLSYATELRTERGDRQAELVGANRDFYAALARHLAAGLGHGFALHEAGGELRYTSSPSPCAVRRARLAWALRRIQGKLLSVLRLVKGLFTFEGGLDYIAWKLERHSGEKIVIPDKVRRRPLIHLWGFFWGLYRRGIFR